MNRLIVACVALVCHAAPASAQNQAGHGVAVFSGEAATPLPAQERDDAAGLATGAGAFTLGRQYDLEYLTRPDVADVAHGAPARDADGRTSAARRADGVRYFRSRGRTLSSDASFTVDTLGGNAVADRAWGLSVGADFGGVSVRAAHQNRHVAQVHLYDLTGATMDAKNSIVAVNVRNRWGTAYAAYSMSRGWGSSPLYNPDNPYGAGVASTSSTDSRDALVGVAVPVTRSMTFLASVIHKNDRDPANRDANQLAVGASYVLSRKTDFYAALSHTVTTNGAGILVGGAARPAGSSAINVGMRHAF